MVHLSQNKMHAAFNRNQGTEHLALGFATRKEHYANANTTWLWGKSVSRSAQHASSLPKFAELGKQNKQAIHPTKTANRDGARL